MNKQNNRHKCAARLISAHIPLRPGLIFSPKIVDFVSDFHSFEQSRFSPGIDETKLILGISYKTFTTVIYTTLH